MSLLYYNQKILQKSYLDQIYSHILDIYKTKFNFLVVSSHPNEYIESVSLLEKVKGPKIIFDLADEWHRIPFYYNDPDVLLILKEYAPTNYTDYKKIIPFPVYFNYKKVEQILPENRKTFLYSSMWLTPSRFKLKLILDLYENNKNYSITWNSNFNSGLPSEAYIENMRNSIVTICPNGYMSPEVARLPEALMCGNIIVCSEKPNYPYYQDNSFFVYKDESEIPDILKNIEKLSSEDLKNIIEKNNILFKKYYDPSSIALNIENHLKSKGHV